MTQAWQRLVAMILSSFSQADLKLNLQFLKEVINTDTPRPPAALPRAALISK